MKWNEWKISGEIYVPNLWHFKQELPPIVFEKCQSSVVRSAGSASQSFQNLRSSSLLCISSRPAVSLLVASNKETMRWRLRTEGGIMWICPSQVAAFLLKHKLFSPEFTAWKLPVRLFLFIQLLISEFKKYGKVIRLSSECVPPCGRDHLFVLFAVILSRKIYTKRVRNTVEKLCLHNRSHYIVYSRPPVVLITLPESRFWNARIFFAHCRISCRGIMEVGMGRTLPINKLHSTRQVICQILKVHNEETAGGWETGGFMTKYSSDLIPPANTQMTGLLNPQLFLQSVLSGFMIDIATSYDFKNGKISPRWHSWA